MFINSQNLSLQEYWREVRKIQAGLPDVLIMVSTPDDRLPAEQRGGVMFVEVDAETAAKLLLARTHRVATEQEIAGREIKRQSDLRDSVRAHLAKQGIIAIQLPEPTSSE